MLFEFREIHGRVVLRLFLGSYAECNTYDNAYNPLTIMKCLHRKENFQIGLIFELCELSSVGNMMHVQKKRYTWKEKFNFLRQIACGMSYLHRHGIIHRDRKSVPANLALSLISSPPSVRPFALHPTSLTR